MNMPKEVNLKLRLELDDGAEVSMDYIVTTIKEMLSIGEEGMGSEPPFGVRDVTPL
jgi:hypothetical protein